MPSACHRSLDESLVVLDQSRQGLEVDDSAVACGYQVDDLADSGGVFVARYHDGARPDLARVACLVKEGPDVAGVIFVVKVRDDVHAVHFASFPRLWTVLLARFGMSGSRPDCGALVRIIQSHPGQGPVGVALDRRSVSMGR